MIRRLTLTALLCLGYLTVNAQIVTPQLNPSMAAKSPAATGWRMFSSVTLGGATAEGDVTQENTAGSMENAGSATYFAAAKGDGSSSPLPSLQAVLKNETVGMEILADSGIGVMQDVDMNLAVPMDSGIPAVGDVDVDIVTNADQANKDLRVYFSYLAAETVSIGVGYRQNVFTETLDLYGSVPALGNMVAADTLQEKEETETGIALVASVRLADVLFLGAGLESMTKEGTKKRDTETDLSGSYSELPTTDYVSNNWMNTYLGASLLFGDPGDMQFRAEYSFIVTPESDEKAKDGKLRNFQRKRTLTYTTLDVLFGNILLTYENRFYKFSKISAGSSNDSNTDRTDSITLMGVGWIAPEGLTISFYTIDYQRTDEDLVKKIGFNPKGFAIYSSYRF